MVPSRASTTCERRGQKIQVGEIRNFGRLTYFLQKKKKKSRPTALESNKASSLQGLQKGGAGIMVCCFVRPRS